MGIIGILRRIHNSIHAYFVKRYRTQEVLKVYRSAHAVELSSVPFQNWPQVQARHEQEISAIKAGKLEIVDRKSWQFPWLPACTCEDSEILTKRGFIPVADMRMTDIFATRNESGFFEWQSPTAINRSRYRGPMVHFRGKHVDAMVTPNHRMIVSFADRVRLRLNNSTDDKIVEAGAVAEDERIWAAGGKKSTKSTHKACYIPLTAKPSIRIDAAAAVPRQIVLKPIKRKYDHTSKTLKIPMHIWASFIGLYLADGSCDGTREGVDLTNGPTLFDAHSKVRPDLLSEFDEDPHIIADRHRHGSGSGFRVRITCKITSPIRSEVAELLAAMPVAWSSDEDGFICGSKALWLELYPLGNSYSKHVPQWMKESSTANIRRMIDWLEKTDGTDYGGGYKEYGTVSERLANDVATILIRFGYSVSTHRVPQPSGAIYTRVHYGHNQYTLASRITTVEYDGYVYCPSVPNGTICLRRNGKIYWTGNSVTRLAQPLSKLSPYNLRRVSRTPVPRRAINLIKGAIISQPWAVEPIDGDFSENEDEQKERIKIAEKIFNHPNNIDSWQQWIEMGLEEYLITGAMPNELRYTLDPERPLKMWVINADSLRVFPAWSESTPDMPHYAQMTGLKGERGAILFYDDEVMYIRDNPTTDSPFGLGCVEVGFQQIIYFLGIQDMAGRSGTDQVHKTWLWWEQPQADGNYQIIRRHIQNELEGQAKISIIGGMKKPEVLEVTPTTEDDLLLNWQELLIRMIANAFNLSAMALGIEHDVNRAVGQVLDDKDFRSAIVPPAKRIQEAFTRKILHEKLGWYDLRFRFLQLDDPDITTKSDLCARMYSMNAITPNQIRKKMGEAPLKSPFADLTQAEQMMLNMETMARVQEASQQRQMEQQQTFMQQHPPALPAPMAPQGQPGQPPQAPGQPQFGKPGQTPMGSPLKLTPANMERGGQIKPPVPMKLPQYPIAGSAHTARDIARMPVNRLTDVWMSGQLGRSPTQLLSQMLNTDPGILEQMTEEVKQFFDDKIEEERQENQIKVPVAILKKWHQDQVRRYRADQKRVSDFGIWLVKYGRFFSTGKPSTRTNRSPIPQAGNKPIGGEPGNLNPYVKY